MATSGNTDTSSFGLDFGLDRRPDPWGLSFVARGTRAEDTGVLTAENYLVVGRAVRKLSESAKLTERLMFYPNFDTSSDWRLTSLTGLEAAVNSWLALRLGFDVRHRNEPIGDAKGTDTTSTASVVFNF